MEKKKKNAGAAILLFGTIALSLSLPKMDFWNLRTVDIVQLVAIALFMSCGVYALVKAKGKSAE